MCDPGRCVIGVGGARLGPEARVSKASLHSLLPRRRRATYCPSNSPHRDREPCTKTTSCKEHKLLSLPTMFFLYNLERQVTLHPSYFGRNMHELVTGKLLKDVEGTCTGRYFIITIMDTFNISEGRILPGSGLAEFTVGYRAVVWRPFKGETVRFRLPRCLLVVCSHIVPG